MFKQIMPEDNDYKLGFSPYGAHQKIIKYVGSNKKVLDVGCGAGYLGEIFKKNGCYVVGIESDYDRARVAEKVLDKLIIDDIENIEDLDYPDNYFDVIVLADILEHLKSPDTVLIRLRKYLNKDGYIVISLPNIARIDIRLKLLCGNFNYEDTGILDKTHLRFFTKKTASGLLERCGYSITGIDYSGFLSGIIIFKPLLNMLAFQFIFLAKPNK